MQFKPKEDGVGGRCCGNVKVAIDPQQFHERRANRGKKQQVIPPFAQNDGADADIEQCNVTEQAKWIVLSAGKQNRGKKSTEQTKNDNDLRIENDGEKKSRDRDARHKCECRRKRNQIIERFRGEDVCVKNEDACGAETLPGNAETFLRGAPTDSDQAEANDRADDDAHARRDEIIFERIFYEENDTKEKNEAANPGEKFYAHEGFPIDGATSGSHRRRSRYWRRTR